MQLKNDSSATITIGTVSIAPGTIADVPWQYIRDDSDALADLISGALTPVTPPDITLEDLPRIYQGVWLSTTTLSANTSAITNTLFVGAFRFCRLHVLTSSGSGTLALTASADGGSTWCVLPDFPNVTLNVGNTAYLAPNGVLLLQATVTAGASGWTGQIQFTMQS